MIALRTLLISLLFTGLPTIAQELKPADNNQPLTREQLLERVAKSSEELAHSQDELTADVMELVEDQTVPQVIALLEEVEKTMMEVTNKLVESKTGGPTLAAETEIIEKIFEAAKQKKKASAEGESQQSMGAMLDMMERMMGRKPKNGKGKPQQGQKPGQQAGEGGSGDSDAANEAMSGGGEGESNERSIPKGSGPAGRALPQEFRKLLDAYNRNDNPESK
jgi:cytochrome c556